jgi:iduronate 2-sulfatase
MRTIFMLLLNAVACFGADQLNVLLIVSDDLTNNALGCYGSKICQTPHIDAFAKQGVQFNRAYCQFPLCNPSRASFLTGLRPDTTRVYENATQFRKNQPNAQSVGQTFQKAGYFVARVGKLYHYGVPAQIGTDGLDDGPSWQQTVNPKGQDKDDEAADRIFSLAPKGMGSGRYGGTLSWFASGGKDEDMTDGKIATEVIKLLHAKKDGPFFLACGFFRPHTPYVAPKEWFDKYPAKDMPVAAVPAGHHAAGPAAAFLSMKKEQEKLTDDLRKQALQAYYASTSHMDAQVGRVLKALDDLKLADKTVVVFISDHGYHLGEHGLWQKMSLFENSARVPMIVRMPGAAANSTACDRTVELTDLHATLADTAGLAVPANLDGVSLKPLLNDAAAKWDRPAYTQVSRGTPTATGETTGGKWYMGRSVRTERYRYTEWDIDGRKGVQLFDYQNDPNELKNLADDPAAAPLHGVLKGLLTPKKSGATP